MVTRRDASSSLRIDHWRMTSAFRGIYVTCERFGQRGSLEGLAPALDDPAEPPVRRTHQREAHRCDEHEAQRAEPGERSNHDPDERRQRVVTGDRACVEGFLRRQPERRAPPIRVEVERREQQHQDAEPEPVQRRGIRQFGQRHPLDRIHALQPEHLEHEGVEHELERVDVEEHKKQQRAVEHDRDRVVSG